MKRQLLLLEDVEALGKKGEVVTAKPGYIRNFLLPRGYAVVASANTLRKQERLRAERAQQAVTDRAEAEQLAGQIQGMTLEIKVKVDPEGHMYGSVSAADIAQLLQEGGMALEKKYVLLPRPIKTTGVHAITLRLKEGVLAACQLKIIPEGLAAEIESAPAPDLAEEEKKEPEKKE